MKRIVLLMGKIETAERNVESYQLMIDTDYISAVYDNSVERAPFYEELSDAFASRIIQESSPLEIGVVQALNGHRINTETNGNEQLSKLEENLAKQFYGMVCSKLLQCPVRITRKIPDPLMN